MNKTEMHMTLNDLLIVAHELAGRCEEMQQNPYTSPEEHLVYVQAAPALKNIVAEIRRVRQ